MQRLSDRFIVQVRLYVYNTLCVPFANLRKIDTVRLDYWNIDLTGHKFRHIDTSLNSRNE